MSRLLASIGTLQRTAEFPAPGLGVQASLEFYVDRLDDPTYVVRLGPAEEVVYCPASTELGEMSAVPIPILIRQLRAGMSSHGLGHTLRALAMATSGAAFAETIGKPQHLGPQPWRVPPPESHRRLRAAWLAWWNENESDVLPVVEDQRNQLERLWGR